MARNTSDERHNEKESKERFEAALKGALKTPHKPLKAKKETPKPAKNPAK